MIVSFDSPFEQPTITPLCLAHFKQLPLLVLVCHLLNWTYTSRSIDVHLTVKDWAYKNEQKQEEKVLRCYFSQVSKHYLHPELMTFCCLSVHLLFCICCYHEGEKSEETGRESPTVLYQPCFPNNASIQNWLYYSSVYFLFCIYCYHASFILLDDLVMLSVICVLTTFKGFVCTLISF